MSTLAASRADAVEIVPQDAVIGAEVRGVDLSKPLDPETFARIEAAYDRHTVLIFRNQKLTPAQHIAFGAHFGPLEIHVLKRYLLEGHPEILLISNLVKENGEFLGLPDAGQTHPSRRIALPCSSGGGGTDSAHVSGSPRGRPPDTPQSAGIASQPFSCAPQQMNLSTSCATNNERSSLPGAF